MRNIPKKASIITSGLPTAEENETDCDESDNNAQKINLIGYKEISNKRRWRFYQKWPNISNS